jgi:GNAT superfamily N-acetyltransferase
VTFRVRLASIQDLAALEAVELLAAERFDAETITAGLAKQTAPAPSLLAAERAKELWVATATDEVLVGFLLAEKLDENLHISEMNVIPSHGGQGIGAALVKAAVAHARTAGYKRLTLTTFASIPWNGPFYAKQGFQEMAQSEVGVGLNTRIEQERALGLINRIAMHRSGA